MKDYSFYIDYIHIDGPHKCVVITDTRMSAVNLFRDMDGCKDDKIVNICQKDNVITKPL